MGRRCEHVGIAWISGAFLMTTETDDLADLATLKRRLIVHDSLIVAGLSLVTVLLFVVTLFLFRSFETHRDELAVRWSGRGQAALTAGRPDQAIVALRTALSYAPGQRSYELLLAQALGNAGHSEESYNYFLGLWTAQPGDGFINLSLARLAAEKGDRQAAIKYYRASIYGTWEGDGTMRRRDVRMELARYLLSQKDDNGARTELLIAGGNNPNNAALEMTLARLLEEASDPADAVSYYKKVAAVEPRNAAALAAAGRLEYAGGKFEEAHRLLERADREFGATKNAREPDDVATLLKNSGRLLELMPSRKLPSHVRVARIVAARGIAKKRFEDCSAKTVQSGGSPSSLQVLSQAWTGKVAGTSAGALLRDTDAQDAAVKLIFDTEVLTSQVCGAPSGDDALLLLLAQSPNALDE